MKNLATKSGASCLAICVGLCLAGATAHALTSSYTNAIPLSLTDLNSDFSFQKFDASGGKQLTGVTVTLNMGLDTLITVHNQGASTSKGKAGTEMSFSVADPLNLVANAPQLDFSFPMASFSNLAAGGTTTLGPFSASASSTSAYTDAAILAEFVGAGNINLNLSSETQTLITFSGGVSTASQVSHAGGSMIVTYSYQNIGDQGASSAALLALGCGSLLILGRRVIRK